jgi:hypothetical protein
MVKKNEKIEWVSDSGKIFDNEIEALRDEVKYWKEQLVELQHEELERISDYNHESSYGSSGGGGHD